METACNSLKSLSFMLISLCYGEACLFLRVFLVRSHKTGIKALKTGLIGCCLIDDIHLGINRRCISNLCVNKTLGLTKVVLTSYFLFFRL